MLIKMDVFRKLKAPWFATEVEAGTDIQICRKAREIDYSVWCDTSLEIGHVKLEREIITPSRVTIKKVDMPTAQLEILEKIDNYANDYTNAVIDYTGESIQSLETLADSYAASDIETFDGTLEEYYRTRGMKQLAKNCLFNCSEDKIRDAMNYIKFLSDEQYTYGLDYCCGSAPVSYELLKSGKEMDFIDIDGAASFEFFKWRALREEFYFRTEVNSNYDFVLALDAIEHLKDWESHLTKIDNALKPGGLLITNYFTLYDYENPEHVSMEKYKVEAFLIERKYKFINPHVWMK